jgi:hypothetical protein
MSIDAGIAPCLSARTGLDKACPYAKSVSTLSSSKGAAYANLHPSTRPLDDGPSVRARGSLRMLVASYGRRVFDVW